MQISTMHVRALVEAVHTLSGDGAQFLAVAGHRPELMHGAYQFIELAEFDRLLQLAVQHTGDEGFGLYWGVVPPLYQFDLGRAPVHASSLRTAFESIAHFQLSLAPRPELSFTERGDSVQISIHPLALSPVGRRVRADFATSVMLRLIKLFGGIEGTGMRELGFEHQAPRYAARYREIFRQPVAFGQRSSGFVLPRAAFDLVNVNHNGELLRAIESVADRVLPRSDLGAPYSDRLRHLVSGFLPRRPHSTELAQALGVSDRTLRRQLTREQATFSQIVQESQLELAKHLLERSGKSIKQVADAAGFLSASSFQRAFKRATGETPASYRRAAQTRPQAQAASAQAASAAETA